MRLRDALEAVFHRETVNRVEHVDIVVGILIDAEGHRPFARARDSVRDLVGAVAHILHMDSGLIHHELPFFVLDLKLNGVEAGSAALAGLILGLKREETRRNGKGWWWCLL